MKWKNLIFFFMLLCGAILAVPIERHHGELLFLPTEALEVTAPCYPWRAESERTHPPITKEYFRCRGSHVNSIRVVEGDKGKLYLEDCGGMADHSLPLRNGKEFIYPILIELLNKVQESTGKKVVITSGHRCPLHNSYIDPSPKNSKSKHQLGAAVTFYVEGLQNQPQEVLKRILSHYPELQQEEDGWGNKELTIRIYWMHEGRDADNDHPYPYLSVEVRFDKSSNQRVEYSWKKAHQPLYRW